MLAEILRRCRSSVTRCNRCWTAMLKPTRIQEVADAVSACTQRSANDPQRSPLSAVIEKGPDSVIKAPPPEATYWAAGWALPASGPSSRAAIVAGCCSDRIAINTISNVRTSQLTKSLLNLTRIVPRCAAFDGRAVLSNTRRRVPGMYADRIIISRTLSAVAKSATRCCFRATCGGSCVACDSSMSGYVFLVSVV